MHHLNQTIKASITLLFLCCIFAIPVSAAPFEIEGYIKQVRTIEVTLPYTFNYKPVISIYIVGHRYGKDYDYQYMVVQDSTQLEGISFSELKVGKYVRVKSRAEPPGMVGKPIQEIRDSRYGCCNYALHIDTVFTPREISAFITRVDAFSSTDLVVTVRENKANAMDFQYLVIDGKTFFKKASFSDIKVSAKIKIARAGINIPVAEGVDHGLLHGADLFAGMVLSVGIEKPALQYAKVEGAASSLISTKLTVPVTLPVSNDGFEVRANNIDTIKIIQLEREATDSSILLMSLERAITKTDSVVISYSGSNIITYDDLCLEKSEGFPVDNLLNGASPRLVSVKTEEPKTLLLLFNKKMKSALKDSFSIYFVSGNKKEITIDSSKFIDGDSMSVMFYIPVEITSKDSLRLSYTGNYMMSVDSGYLKPFGQNVENTILPSPEVLAANVTDYGYSITLELDTWMAGPVSQSNCFTIKAGDNVLETNKLQIEINKIIVRLVNVINSGENVKISYSGSELVSVEGAKLKGFTDRLVTNDLPTMTVFDLPGKIEAENAAASKGTKTENTSDAGGGLNVGYIDANDWLEYAINVKKAGTYTIYLRVAASSSAGELIVQLPGKGFANIDTITLPVTGGWQTWTTTESFFELDMGIQRIRLFVSKGGFNINWFEIKSGNLTVRPKLLDAKVADSGTSIELTYDIDLADFTGNPADFILRVAGSLMGVESVAPGTDKKTLVLTTSNIITKDDKQILLSYKGQTIESVVGVKADKFDNKVVYNGSLVMSISKTDMKNEVYLYPNPASDIIIVESELFIYNCIELLDIYGRSVWVKKVAFEEKQKIGLSLPCGIYQVKLSNEKEYVTKTLIIYK